MRDIVLRQIEHLVEPSRLWVSWQSPDASGASRRRHVVAEITKEDGEPIFRYLDQTPQYQAARREGFEGYPAFNRSKVEHRKGVLEAFVRRLPSRKRGDFSEYLEKHRLPSDFKGSDFALLGYTGAKLPGDGFELCPDLTTVDVPLETIVEVAGFWRQGVPQSELEVGDEVRFCLEPDNAADPNAIAIYSAGRRIGYIPSPMLPMFNNWLRSANVTAHIDRLNGKPERPLVYLFVAVAPPS
ncbi:HIRAN domain-containing protein [Caballeronia sp. NCTM1]|uniref:HIRAN domain-containing protein n=1 Tax=Caballeronia sp. NCTM1 TaxID=2921753 RepID=UPI002027A911|nr:HIRAN domain-containing protein [Caballeronia sp. NCTM1]